MRRRMVGRAISSFVALFVAFGQALAQAPACDQVEVPRLVDAPVSPPDSSARGGSYWDWSHAFERETTGVGVLSPSTRGNGGPPGYDWLPEVSLPLYARAGEAVPSAWMHLGWWVAPADRSADRVLGYRGMMETAYEQASIVVTREGADGWLEVWVDIGPIPRAASHGLLWTHSCLLDLGPTSLELSRWEELFVGPGAPPLSFLGEERHALRSAADAGSGLVAWLDADDEVELLEFAGDWARVRALRPGVYLSGCLGEEWRGEDLSGWVRWRSAESGTWLWYPTRGC